MLNVKCCRHPITIELKLHFCGQRLHDDIYVFSQHGVVLDDAIHLVSIITGSGTDKTDTTPMKALPPSSLPECAGDSLHIRSRVINIQFYAPEPPCHRSHQFDLPHLRLSPFTNVCA